MAVEGLDTSLPYTEHALSHEQLDQIINYTELAWIQFTCNLEIYEDAMESPPW